MNKKFILTLLASLGTMTVGPASSQSAPPKLTLDQAVRQVQADTGGKVLSAEPRQVGRRSEYRIKVLTPTGHVRVVVVPAVAARNRTQSSKNPPARRAGTKEKR